MRLSMRRDADRNKQEIMKTLDQLKAKGKINPRALARFGINTERFAVNSQGVMGGTLQPKHTSRLEFSE
jgi:hypothetical protein